MSKLRWCTPIRALYGYLCISGSVQVGYFIYQGQADEGVGFFGYVNFVVGLILLMGFLYLLTLDILNRTPKPHAYSSTGVNKTATVGLDSIMLPATKRQEEVRVRYEHIISCTITESCFPFVWFSLVLPGVRDGHSISVFDRFENIQYKQKVREPEVYAGCCSTFDYAQLKTSLEFMNVHIRYQCAENIDQELEYLGVK